MLYRDYLKSKYQNTAVKLANAEGVPCVLEYSKGKNLRNYEVCGNSVQSGTPSPESPVEIQSVGDLTTKNLINESAITLSSGYWSDSGGNQINNNSRFIRISSVKCNPNETYTLSSNLKIYTIWFFNNNTSISKTYRENTVAVFKTPENCNSLRISLVNTSGNTDTIAFKWIQLELGSAATEYEPYHKYDIPITVTGKNLIPYPYKGSSVTANGITIKINDDRTITVNGTASTATTFTIAQYTIQSGTYTLSGTKNGSLSTYYMAIGGTSCKDVGNGSSVTFDTETTISIYIIIKSGATLSNAVFKPQLEEGSTATTYEPYIAPVTTNIYLDEPLRKVGDYADYIDFKNQKVIRKIAKKTYIGQSNEAWNNGSSDNHIKYIIPVPNDFSNGYGLEGTYGLSNIFVCKFANEAHTFYFTGDKSNSWRRNVFYNDTELTVDEWKSKLTEWNEIGNPLTIYYPLLTSREETISLPALKTFKGTNVMSVDTSIQPSNIKANYIRT